MHSPPEPYGVVTHALRSLMVIKTHSYTVAACWGCPKTFVVSHTVDSIHMASCAHKSQAKHVREPSLTHYLAYHMRLPFLNMHSPPEPYGVKHVCVRLIVEVTINVSGFHVFPRRVLCFPLMLRFGPTWRAGPRQYDTRHAVIDAF